MIRYINDTKKYTIKIQKNLYTCKIYKYIIDIIYL